MWVTILKANNFLKVFKSLRFQIAAAFAGVVLFTTLILNLYPSTTLRKLLIDAKKSEMVDRGITISTVLQNINYDNYDNLKESVSKVIDAETENVVIANVLGGVIYSTSQENSLPNERFKESIKSALMGFDVFECIYDENSFRSSITMPIMRQGYPGGIIIVTQTDKDSSKLLTDIRNNIISISIAIVIFGGALVAIFVKMFSKKVTALLNGVHQVESGNYSYKIKDDGEDELSLVAKEFNMLSEKLRSVENTRQEFVSNASHELKTPLASIKLLSDSIVQTKNISKEDTIDFLKDINTEIDRLIRITENLLYITKTDSRPMLVKEVCNAAKITERCREILAANASHRMVEIKVRIKDDCRVLANNDMLYQVIFNVMENAVKYNRENGAVVATVEKAYERCRITIEDTGIGMPFEEQDKIFERFYRVDKARSRAIGGTGLGLSIVKDNITLMGGTISVESRIGVGSKFTIMLQLAPIQV